MKGEERDRIGEGQTSLRILFFSSSPKSRKGKMERIKRAAEKRRAWLEVSTNNVYFIHPSLLTSVFLFPSLSFSHSATPHAAPYPFRTRPQWPISKVDRKKEVAQFFFSFFFFFIYVVNSHVSVHRHSGQCVQTKVKDDARTLKLHLHYSLSSESQCDEQCYFTLAIRDVCMCIM